MNNQKQKQYRTHKHKSNIKKPKIFYMNTNKLVQTSYTVIKNQNIAICTTIVDKFIDTELGVNKLKNFPTNLGYYPQVTVLNIINESTFTMWIYRIDIEFDNNYATVDDCTDEKSNPTKITNDIIININNYLFTLNEPIFDDKEGLDYLYEQI